MIKRQLYMDKIEPFIDEKLVKILTGIRRSGKSTILEGIAELLAERGVALNRIISINFDSYEYEEIKNGSQMYHFLKKKIFDDGKFYFLLDEIQEIKEWEKAINSLMIDLQVDIYVTGSNSKLMSSEISTYLSGRYVTIHVLPLSFSEYIDFKKTLGNSDSTRELLNSYIRLGGFPTIALKDYTQNEAYKIVKDIYNSVIFSDIVKRNQIRKFDLFERIVKFLFENVGKTFSVKSIINYLKAEKLSIDVETVYNYIDMLKKAYIIYSANRYDAHGKAVMKTQEKYFLADPSLQYSMLGFSTTAIASMLENIVYLELIRRGYETYVGNVNGKEIDFIGVKFGEKIYIQVCRNIPETKEGMEREFGNLELIQDNYPKYLVTLDEFASGNVEGIKILHLTDFLLNKW